MLRLLFSFRGRTSRIPHLFGSLLIWVLVAITIAVAFFAFPWAGLRDGSATIGAGGVLGVALLVFVATVTVGWAILALAAKRLHDMDMSAWHLLWIIVLGSVPANVPEGSLSHPLLIVVEVIAFAAWAWIFFPPGTRGANRFGPAPGGAATPSAPPT